LKNEGETRYCLDYALPQTNPLSGQLSIYPCHGQGGNQFFEHTTANELRFNSEREMCVATTEDRNLMMKNCVLNSAPLAHQWIQTQDLQFKSLLNHLCLQADVGHNSKMQLLLEPCDPEERRQKWKWHT